MRGKRFIPTESVADSQKQCRKCLCVKERTLFFKHKAASDGLSGNCKGCDKARTYAYRAENPGAHAKIQAKYYAANKEAQAITSKRWAEAHPEYERERYKRRRADPVQVEKMRASTRRRAALHRMAEAAENSLTTEQIVWLRSQPCAYCMETGREIDHVVPLVAGGAHSFDNVVTSCRSCNAQKGAKSLLHFLLFRKRLRQELANGVE